MNDMTPGERAFADMAARGMDAAALLASMRAEPQQQAGGSVLVTSYDDAGEPVQVPVTMLEFVPNLRTALALAFGWRAKAMKAKSFEACLGCIRPFIEFLDSRGLNAVKPRHIDDDLLNDYRDWLDDFEKTPPIRKRKTVSVYPAHSCGKLKVDTKRRYMSELLTVLRHLRVDPVWWFEISPRLDLIRSNDWNGVVNDRRPVDILTRPQLKMLVRICREEVIATTARLKLAWAVMDDADPAASTDLADREILLEVQALHRIFGGLPPKQQNLSKALNDHDPKPLPRLRRLDSRSYNAAIATIYPTGRLLMPFILLFAIYYRYNRSVVTTLKPSDFSVQPSIAGGTRLLGKPFKNRAGKTQYASWPVNNEPDNPSEMMKTLERWTGSLRPLGPSDHRNHIFLARAAGPSARSMAAQEGFNLAFIKFLEDNSAKLKRRFLFRAIRPSVINLVHHLFDGDLLATSEAGQHGVDVMMNHYLFDGARKANAEALVGPMHLREAWRRSSGKVDGREDKRRGDVSAATPGFTCRDRYASTMAGQKPGRLCTAYGMCPNCRLGGIDVSVPENYALMLKLRDAMIRSRPRMPVETWLSRWSPVLDRLNLVTIRSFTEEVRAVAQLDIPPLPTME
ncbi:hypothetical protein [Sphingomonas melonis]|uniref:Uncharacterized protein n=1 Tax=Sphingomonas melonis TaxID=152682 RepID=A0A7Y9FLP5_9SPHN|nr:hypothetical protein [Sphingomonas melonis]NYD89182.1 hypothetical protein [Sphingomonas melonis]